MNPYYGGRRVARRFVALSSTLPGVVVVAAILISATELGAQSEADNIATLEQARIAAIRAGRDASSFYWPAYFGINGDGSTENFEQFSNAAERPVVRLDDAFSVQVYRVAALVTGVEWIGIPPVAHRFLRVWSASGDEWRLAVSQRTVIGGESIWAAHALNAAS